LIAMVKFSPSFTVVRIGRSVSPLRPVRSLAMS
jgi:hypothetical protein